jgi:hypothetical protein
MWGLFPVLLLLAGFAYLPSAAPGARRWPAVWAGAVAAGITLEALFITGFGQPGPAAAYIGPAIVNWVWLAEALGFATVGAAMIAILTCAERSARRQNRDDEGCPESHSGDRHTGHDLGRSWWWA